MDKYVEAWAVLDDGKCHYDMMGIGRIYGFTLPEAEDMEQYAKECMEVEIGDAEIPDNALCAIFKITNILFDPGQQTFPETGQWDFPPHWEMNAQLLGFDTVVDGEVRKFKVGGNNG